ncbi:hypothetical protein [Burkholderia contaminans]|uniref:hypothetical protein n=1 Tax=Burkholderia contaminans TaxID=488447 RepID=UPI00158E7BD4|nr:hypothetical protein [Burkholderia contaminans]
MKNKSLKDEFASVKHFVKHGEEKKVISVLAKAFLKSMSSAGFHVRDPLELVTNEEGREFLAAWAEAVSPMRLTHVIAILQEAGQRLGKGKFLTDINSFELVSWTKTKTGFNSQILMNSKSMEDIDQQH